MSKCDLTLSLPNLFSNSPYCLQYNFHIVSSENFLFTFLFIIITFLFNIVLVVVGEILSWLLKKVKRAKSQVLGFFFGCPINIYCKQQYISIHTPFSQNVCNRSGVKLIWVNIWKLCKKFSVN